MSTGRTIAIVAIVLAVIVGIAFYSKPTYRGTRAGSADENYLKSTDCRACHTGQYASWARTYHSRMTQEARPLTVQGDFEQNNELHYLGVTARMEKRGDTFSMTLGFPDGRTQTVKIDRTVWLATHRTIPDQR